MTTLGPNLGVFPLEQTRHVGVAKSERPRLTNYFRRIPTYVITIHQRHRRTGRQTDNMRSQYRALHKSASRGKNHVLLLVTRHISETVRDRGLVTMDTIGNHSLTILFFRYFYRMTYFESLRYTAFASRGVLCTSTTFLFSIYLRFVVSHCNYLSFFSCKPFALLIVVWYTFRVGHKCKRQMFVHIFAKY